MSSGPKKNLGDWFKGLRIEFGKITWPDKDTLIRETVTVTTASIIIGVIIATLDMVLQYGIKFLI